MGLHLIRDSPGREKCKYTGRYHQVKKWQKKTYDSIAGLMRTHILSGVHQPGARLPDRQTLARRYGTRIVTIDLTDDSLLSSEYYYVLPNDVIYVEPNKFRIYTVRTLPWLNQATFEATLLSTAFLILNLFRK